MSAVEQEDKLASAKRQGQAQFDSIKEMVEALRAAVLPLGEPDAEYEERIEEAERAIHEDSLSVAVRSGWYAPGAKEDSAPAEYEILLCTGGPACRIVGELSGHGEPETAVLEVQDWFTPWVAMRPQVGLDDYDPEPILLAYARCFYFGEG